MTSGSEDSRIRMETLLAHIQQDVEQIHSSLTWQFEKLRELEQRFARMERELELMQEPTEQRDPLQEKPPHY